MRGDDALDPAADVEVADDEQIVDAVAKVAEGRGVSRAQVALAWVLQRGEHIVPIPGTKRRKYLEQNIAAAEIIFNEADLLRLKSIVPLGTDTGKPYDEFSMNLID